MPLEPIFFNNKQAAQDPTHNPTADELQQIQHRIATDEKFCKLFTDYVKSLSDPSVREEEDQYLAQVEAEAKKEGNVSFDFVFPSPCFFVELVDERQKEFDVNSKREEEKKRRVFLNFCESEKIEIFSEEEKEKNSGKISMSQWRVPVSLGQPREEVLLSELLFSSFESSKKKNEKKETKNEKNEKRNEKGWVYDVIFNPRTIQLTTHSDRFLIFLVEIAVEHINEQFKTNYTSIFKRWTSSSFPLKSLGKPANLTLYHREAIEDDDFNHKNKNKNEKKLDSRTKNKLIFGEKGELKKKCIAVSNSNLAFESSLKNADNFEMQKEKKTSILSSSSSSSHFDVPEMKKEKKDPNTEIKKDLLTNENKNSLKNESRMSSIETTGHWPPFTHLQQYEKDWLDAWHFQTLKILRPTRLCFQFWFASSDDSNLETQQDNKNKNNLSLLRASEIDLSVSADGTELFLNSSPHHSFGGSLFLPFKVMEKPQRASFVVQTQCLTLILNVVTEKEMLVSDLNKETEKFEVDKEEKEEEEENVSLKSKSTVEPEDKDLQTEENQQATSSSSSSSLLVVNNNNAEMQNQHDEQKTKETSSIFTEMLSNETDQNFEKKKNEKNNKNENKKNDDVDEVKKEQDKTKLEAEKDKNVDKADTTNFNRDRSPYEVELASSALACTRAAQKEEENENNNNHNIVLLNDDDDDNNKKNECQQKKKFSSEAEKTLFDNANSEIRRAQLQLERRAARLPLCCNFIFELD